MNEFRSQLGSLIEEMLAAGARPVFLRIDLDGAEEIKSAHGAESLDKFKSAVISAVVTATDGADAFTYGDDRVIAILDDSWDRLRTFAMIHKLRRQIPFLGQSFDCFLRPDFDVIEYHDDQGLHGVIAMLTRPRPRADEEVA
jgi:hypothetical protein